MLDFLKFENWISANVANLSFSKSDMELIRPAFNFFIENKSIEIDSSNFLSLHSNEKSKLLGITYTPKNIRLKLLNTVFEKYVKSSNKAISEAKFCDPCCGSGTFAIDAACKFQNFGITIKDAFNKNIYFSDKDKISVLLSLANVFTFLLKENVNPIDIFPNVKVSDFFTSSDKYDLFVTNPPYVKLQNISDIDRLHLKEKFGQIFSGSLGTAPLFLYHMKNLLETNGLVGIITQNNFFTSNSGVKIRESIGRNLFRIDTFGSRLIFDDVSTYTCLIFLSNENNNTFIYSKDDKESRIQNDHLDSKKWRLGSEEELKFLLNAENKGVPLNKICNIFVGIATLKDKAYTVFYDNGKWISISPTNEIVEVESDLIQKLIKVSDFSNEKAIVDNKRGIIYPYFLDNNKLKLIEENVFKENYPKTYHALSLWKLELMQRSSYKKEKHTWYQWGRNQSMLPIKNKLLTKTFNDGPNFMMDESNSLISNGYGLVVKNEKNSIRFIQKILNSTVFAEYAKLTSFEIDGNYQCYQKNFIEKFSIPQFILDNQDELISLQDNEFNDYLKDYYYSDMPL